MLTAIFTMAFLPPWMSRTAIQWDITQLPQQDDGTPCCAYWNWSFDFDADSSTTCHDRKRVTYRELMTVAGLAASEVIQQQQSQQHQLLSRKSSSDDELPIIIVVAIPEGPWQALAVLMVHALNYHPTAAILVPLEPSEAKERNRKILQDIQPTLVLGIGGTPDFDRLKELLGNLDDNILTPALLDFQGMVQDVWRERKEDCTSEWWNVISQSADADAEEWTIPQWVNRAMGHLDEDIDDPQILIEPEKEGADRISHIVYTSGTTGQPKGCISSANSLQHYLRVKNEVYNIQQDSCIFLASALSFDPCLSDILATFYARAQLALCPRSRLLDSLGQTLQHLEATHILCTPTLWGMVDTDRRSLPFLKVIALGGEPVPRRIQQQWARNSIDDDDAEETKPRLFATYGVTEACVYQTAGEIIWNDDREITKLSGRGQYVGKAFRGLGVRICNEGVQDTLVDVEPGQPGEVVLYGAQLDRITGYWRRNGLAHKFLGGIKVDGTTRYHYRTGDRGVCDSNDQSLTIIGRIDGEEGMVKVNGVRIEVGEIETAVVDIIPTTVDVSVPPNVVEACMVRVIQSDDENSTRSDVHVYCVLSDQALMELDLPMKMDMPKSGILVSEGVLLTLLRARCSNSLKAACIPNVFIVIPRLPLSPTGKRAYRELPPISEVNAMEKGEGRDILLKDYGRLGNFLAELIRECLNLQPLQQEMMTTSVTLDMLGGDSLAATRIIRALYAFHHGLENNRYLGGDFGKFEGVFDVVHLLCAQNLGEYVDMLERNGVGLDSEGGLVEVDKVALNMHETPTEAHRPSDLPRNPLYDSLVQAATHGQTSMAIALLEAGVDPNYGNHGKRLGKVSGGFFFRKFAFHSSPLHLACKHGDEQLVEHLLYRGANCKSPDAAGLYPLHLVASSMDEIKSTPEEDARRLQCVKRLLKAGAPLVMRDGNHQTILHAAARSGHASLLRHAMTLWRDSGKENPNTKVGKKFVNWLDRWYRTPVHWAVLNGRLEALKVALELGCTPTPYKPKAGKKTSVAMEYPLELCDRLYPKDCTDEAKRAMGDEMRHVLKNAITQSFESGDTAWR